MLLSGDRQTEVDRVAAEAGFDCAEGGLTPVEKAERLGSERRGRGVAVAMVGDGVNDAVALSSADVGIAFGRAADLSRERAEVSILREDLRDVAALFSLARRTLRTVRENLLWAFGYNLAGVGLAAAGRLSPIVAAAAMVLSSLFVVTNSMRLRTR
jgi:Cu+-exporting ATPase